MNKKLLSIIVLGALLASVLGLSACTEKEPEWKESGYFKYTEIKYEEDGLTKDGICIVKLTDEGGEQEIIYIPTEIDGRPVVKVGMLDERSALTMGNDPSYYSLPKKTKRVYIPWQINKINIGIFQSDHHILVFLANTTIEAELCTTYGYKLPIFYRNQTSIGYDSFPGNIIYRYNYINAPNQGIFMIDNVEVNEKLIVHPNSPIRDGYHFTGWYKEPECINTWDFENEKQGEDYISLYAKWIKE